MTNRFPSIYDDETVYSWFCRYLVSSGIWREHEIAKELFVNSTNVISKLFIGNINKDTENNIEKVISIENLLKHHTMFYVYTGYCSNDYANEFLYNLKTDCYKTELNIRRPRSENRQLKYCPMCIIEDRKKYGEAYWHNIHQIRMLPICPIHKCKLHNSEIRYIGYGRVREKLSPLEMMNLNSDVEYNTNEILDKIVEYAIDRYYKQDIKDIGIDYLSIRKENWGLRSNIISFYKKHGINFCGREIDSMVYDNRKNFYTMSAIYYYLKICH